MGSPQASNDENCQARGGLSTDEKIKLITRNLQVYNLNIVILPGVSYFFIVNILYIAFGMKFTRNRKLLLILHWLDW